MNLGICTAGCESAFKEHLQSSTNDVFPYYLEIGIADGRTLQAVSLLPEFEMCLGVDVESSQHAVDFLEREKLNPKLQVFLRPNGIQDGKLLSQLNLSFNFVFIDGCHGKKCAMADFEAVEPWIKRGGIVCFHDACEEDQGSSFQEHCGEFINVRNALVDLGLLYGRRSGWQFIEEIHGDKTADPPGNGMCFFKKL